MNQTSRFLVVPLRAPVSLFNLTHVLENSREGAQESHTTSQLPEGSLWALSSRPVPEAAAAGGKHLPADTLESVRSHE